MLTEKTIVATPLFSGTVTQQLKSIDTLMLKKQQDVLNQLDNMFSITSASTFIEHIDFLKHFFIENNNKINNDWSEKHIIDNEFFTNDLKSHIVKFYELFRDLDKLNYAKELLTKTNENENKPNIN
jgi:hypothetical protein